MNRQQSFQNDNPTLFVVATPIGNLSEMTNRALEVLRTVDVIACEDTRTTMKLLSHFQIKNHCIAHHLHNENQSCNGILSLLEEGKNVAIVSDAGYPLISDPGELLVSKVIEKGYNVVPISGANAMLNALVASGIATLPFYFKGFLSNKESQVIKELESMRNLNCTVIFYESPHRIKKTLEALLQIYGDCNICLARELTKRYEEFIRGKVSEILDVCDEIKGEMVVVVEKYNEQVVVDEISIIKAIDEMVANGEKTSSAIKIIAKKFNVNKNEVYEMYHRK